ncbi:MAG: hypothetical protein ACPLKZ_07970, partial [Candidatus Bathyarchaeales archaeon]
DLALFKQKLSISLITPAFLVCQVAPALLADRQLFSFKENIQLYVLAFALIIPGISTMLQHRLPPVIYRLAAEIAFKTRCETTFRCGGER